MYRIKGTEVPKCEANTYKSPCGEAEMSGRRPQASMIWFIRAASTESSVDEKAMFCRIVPEWIHACCGTEFHKPARCMWMVASLTDFW
jgi:hypothetical protein